jgi:hypothetical protein
MTMDYNKTLKNAEKFICVRCNFKCIKQSEYNRHLLTAKHKRMTMDDRKTPKNAENFICECGKIYKYRQGLHKHKRRCSLVNNTIVCMETEEKPSMMDLLTQNKELMELLVLQNKEHKEETNKILEENTEMRKTIQEIVPKIGNNNNNTNKFNLNVFLNEDCKDALNFSEFIDKIQVSFEDLENQAQLGYVNGFSKLFIENLKELGTTKRPIHCTDVKRNTLYIKENDAWEKEGSQESLKKGIQKVAMKSHKSLSELKDANPDDYSDMDSEFSNKCIEIQRNITPGSPKEQNIDKIINNIKIGSVVGK